MPGRLSADLDDQLPEAGNRVLEFGQPGYDLVQFPQEFIETLGELVVVHMDLTLFAVDALIAMILVIGIVVIIVAGLT